MDDTNDFTLVSTTDTPEEVAAALADDQPSASAASTEVVAAASGEAHAAAGAEHDETGETTGEPAAETAGVEADKPPKKRSALDERFSELTTKRKAAEARAETAEARTLKIEQELAQLRAAKTGAPAETGDSQDSPAAAHAATATAAEKPRLENFATEEEYHEALTDWKLDAFKKELVLERQAFHQATVQETEARTVAQQYVERSEAVRQEFPDFDEVIAASPAEISQEMQDAILRSERGPALAYHLGKHPDVAAHIRTLTVGQMLMEMGRLEERLGVGTAGAAPSGIAARAAAVPKITKAPRPIVPANAGAVLVQKTVDEMTHEEYKQWRKNGGGV